MGFYNVEAWVRAFPFHMPYELEEGGVTLIAQSGSVLTSLLWNDRKLRFNLAVSPGQELVTTVSDYLDYALEQESTRVVALFVETVRRPAAFVAGAAEGGGPGDPGRRAQGGAHSGGGRAGAEPLRRDRR